jgi:hypothetical protein
MMDSSKRQDDIGGSRLFFSKPINAPNSLETIPVVIPSFRGWMKQDGLLVETVSPETTRITP